MKAKLASLNLTFIPEYKAVMILSWLYPSIHIFIICLTSLSSISPLSIFGGVILSSRCRNVPSSWAGQKLVKFSDSVSIVFLGNDKSEVFSLQDTFSFLKYFFYSLFICIFFSMLSWTFLSFFFTVFNFLSFLQSPLLTSTQPCILHSFV